MTKKLSDEEIKFFLVCLKEKMRKGNLTQAKVSSGAGVHNSILSRFVNKRIQSPSLETLIKIATYFGSTAEEFIIQGRVLAPDLFVGGELEAPKMIACHLEIEIIENGIMLTVGGRKKYKRLFINSAEFLSNDSFIQKLDRALSGDIAKFREQTKSKNE
jgi:transcriptional regulator with XRE-family HTH domain